MPSTKKSPYKVGSLVRAKTRIFDVHLGQRRVHAVAGDLGHVTGVSPGSLPMVRFDKSPETIVVSPQEIEKP